MKHKLFNLLILSLTMSLTACGGFNIPDDSGDDDSNSGGVSESGQEPPTSDSNEPGDPYQVSESFWNKNILQMGYFDATHNFTAQASVTEDNNATRVLYKNDNGKYYLRVDGNDGMEMYLEPDGNGLFFVYSLLNGTWTKTPKPVEGYNGMTLAQELVLPLQFSLLTYNPQTHAYEMPDFDMDGQTLSNISVKFENQQLISVSYAGSSLGDDGVTHTYSANVNFYDHGKTTVTFPEIGGGEIQEDNPFVNKMIIFSYMEADEDMIERYQPMFQESFMNLFTEGEFQFIFFNQGKASAFLGTYLVSEKLDAATLSVTKRYDGVSNMYIDDNLTYYLRLVEGDDGRTYYQYDTQLGSSSRGSLFFVDSGVAPTPYELPDDPNQGGDETDKKYKVTEDIWNSYMFNQAHMSSTFNATVTCVYANGSESFEIDQRKIHITATYTQGATSEKYYEYKGNNKYDSYNYDERSGKWVKQEVELSIDWFDDEIGLLKLPFSKVSYNEFQKYYTCSSFKYYPYPEDTSYYEEYQNIHVAFVEGKLQSIEYKYLGSQFSFNYGNYNKTKVQLPDVGGGSVTPDNCNELLRNSVFDYAGLVNAADYTGAEVFNASFTGSYITFFNDDTFEYVRFKGVNATGTVIDEEAVIVGTFKVVDGKDASYKIVGLTATAMITNGVTQVVENENMTLRYYTETNQLKMPINDDGNYNSACAVFNKTSKTPTHYEYTGPVTPVSNWPAEEIKRGLTSIGLTNENIPELPYVKNGTVRTTEKSIIIICSFDDEITAANAFVGYTATLTNEENGFTLDYSSLANGDGSYTYYSKSGEMKLTTTYSGGETGTIIAEPASKYPSDAIDAFLTKQGWTDKMPSLYLDGVDATYEFSETEGMGYITITNNGGGTADALLRNVFSILSTNGFKYSSYYVNGSAEKYYTSPNGQYLLGIFTSGNALVITFGDVTNFEAFSTTYPSEAISARRPEGITDQLPLSGISGAEYYTVEDGETGLYVYISLPEGIEVSAAMQQLARPLLQRAGYTNFSGTDEYYNLVSSHNQVIVDISEQDGMVVVYIDYNDPNESYICTYDIVFDNDYEPNKDGAQLYAWVWGGVYGTGEWVEICTDTLEDGSIRYYIDLDSTATHMIIVRFSDDSQIDWPGEDDLEHVIWNRTHPDGIELPQTVAATITAHLGNGSGY